MYAHTHTRKKGRGLLPDTSQSILDQYGFPFELIYPPASASRVGRTTDISNLAKVDLFGLIVSVLNKHQSVQLLLRPTPKYHLQFMKKSKIQTGQLKKGLSSRGRGAEQGVGEKGPDV